MKAEYIATSKAAKEAVWLKNFLSDLEVVPDMDKAITLYCDNSRAVAHSKESCSHKRGKHIERKYHLIREIVGRRDVKVTKIPALDNLVDSFTKANLCIMGVQPKHFPIFSKANFHPSQLPKEIPPSQIRP